MAEFPKLIMTNKAIEMIAESQLAGNDLIITKVKIGDGQLADGADIKAMTDVVAARLVASMTDSKLDGGQVTVNFAISNSELEAGFFAREIGIFAKLGEAGAETLYAYTNAGNLCDWIPDKHTPIDSQIVNATIVVGNASNVVVNVSDKAFVTTKDLESHNTAADAHADIRNKIGTDISSHNTSTSAHTDIRNKIQTVQQNASLFMLPVKRKANYAVGDCASATGLPSWAYLECITAGTTAETEPLFGGGRVADGTCVWIIKDVRCPYSLGEFVFKMNEPKDYEYLLLCDGSTISEENYPELVAVLGGTQLPNLIDRFLQGSAIAGTYKEAGLPNITGDFTTLNEPYVPYFNGTSSGALSNPVGDQRYRVYGTTNGSTNYNSLHFDASKSNTIYGNSTTVQPPAFTTKIYICYAG